MKISLRIILSRCITLSITACQREKKNSVDWTYQIFDWNKISSLMAFRCSFCRWLVMKELALLLEEVKYPLWKFLFPVLLPTWGSGFKLLATALVPCFSGCLLADSNDGHELYYPFELWTHNWLFSLLNCFRCKNIF